MTAHDSPIEDSNALTWADILRCVAEGRPLPEHLSDDQSQQILVDCVEVEREGDNWHEVFALLGRVRQHLLPDLPHSARDGCVAWMDSQEQNIVPDVEIWMRGLLQNPRQAGWTQNLNSTLYIYLRKYLPELMAISRLIYLLVETRGSERFFNALTEDYALHKDSDTNQDYWRLLSSAYNAVQNARTRAIYPSIWKESLANFREAAREVSETGERHWIYEALRGEWGEEEADEKAGETVVELDTQGVPLPPLVVDADEDDVYDDALREPEDVTLETEDDGLPPLFVHDRVELDDPPRRPLSHDAPARQNMELERIEPEEWEIETRRRGRASKSYNPLEPAPLDQITRRTPAQKIESVLPELPPSYREPMPRYTDYGRSRLVERRRARSRVPWLSLLILLAAGMLLMVTVGFWYALTRVPRVELTPTPEAGIETGSTAVAAVSDADCRRAVDDLYGGRYDLERIDACLSGSARNVVLSGVRLALTQGLHTLTYDETLHHLLLLSLEHVDNPDSEDYTALHALEMCYSVLALSDDAGALRNFIDAAADAALQAQDTRARCGWSPVQVLQRIEPQIARPTTGSGRSTASSVQLTGVVPAQSVEYLPRTMRHYAVRFTVAADASVSLGDVSASPGALLITPAAHTLPSIGGDDETGRRLFQLAWSYSSGAAALSYQIFVPETEVTYTVTANDSLAALAERFGLTVGDLRRLNPGAGSGDVIRPGARLLAAAVDAEQYQLIDGGRWYLLKEGTATLDLAQTPTLWAPVFTVTPLDGPLSYEYEVSLR